MTRVLEVELVLANGLMVISMRVIGKTISDMAMASLQIMAILIIRANGSLT